MAAPSWSSTDTITGLQTSVKAAAALTATDAPTGTEGLFLGNVQAFDVTLEAAAGQTLSGAGTLECWLKTSSGWGRAKELDLSVSTAWSTGVRRVTFLGPSAGIGIPVIARQERVAYNPNGVTVSAGTCTVYLDGLVGGRAP